MMLVKRNLPVSVDESVVSVVGSYVVSIFENQSSLFMIIMLENEVL